MYNIISSCIFGKRNYRVLVIVSVCVCVCECVCVCTKAQKERVYENNSDKFDIGHSRTKVKVMARLQNFSPFSAVQLAGPITQLWKLILSKYVHLILIYKIYEYRQA